MLGPRGGCAPVQRARGQGPPELRGWLAAAAGMHAQRGLPIAFPLLSGFQFRIARLLLSHFINPHKHTCGGRGDPETFLGGGGVDICSSVYPGRLGENEPGSSGSKRSRLRRWRHCWLRMTRRKGYLFRIPFSVVIQCKPR